MAEKIVLASGKGGVGKSTLTAGLCGALSSLGKKVLAVDCDVGLGCLDIMLGIGSQCVFNWGDVILGGCGAQKALAECGGVSLLAAPREFCDCFTPEAMRDMLTNYDSQYDFILIDAPAGITRGFHLAAAAADMALVIATPDAVSVRGAQSAGMQLLDLGAHDVRLVINRFGKKSVERRRLLNIDDTIDSTGIRLIGVVPENLGILSSLMQGAELPRRNEARRGFLRIARRLCGENVPLMIE